MTEITTADWQRVEIAPYGAVLHLPAGWETLPPVPSNGPEVVRATGGPDKHLILFKLPTRNRPALEVAASAKDRLAAHGFEDFTLTPARFAGTDGAVLEFVSRDGGGGLLRRTREYFAVRGGAAFILGMGSSAWERQVPLIEAIADRFELS